jgi:pimeloyl-ACP methyl ester carboxylesterase
VDTALAPLLRRVPVRGLELSLREWPADGRPFLLVHGLASNAKTWDGVARILATAGHRVVAVDQRGHGLSDKPDDGYDFDNVTADLRALIEALDLRLPVLAGQSWGGNVVLDYATRYPGTISGLVLVDGGFIDLSASGRTWEETRENLRPPPLAGTPRELMLQRMRSFHKDWNDEQIEMQMGNFETLPDGTIRPWLSLERHMLILRSLWLQRPSYLFPEVQTPTLIAVAGLGPPERRARKAEEVGAATAGIKRVRSHWFEDSEHDIHVHHPRTLAEWMLSALEDGFFESE